jgi:hypothetical protein
MLFYIILNLELGRKILDSPSLYWPLGQEEDLGKLTHIPMLIHEGGNYHSNLTKDFSIEMEIPGRGWVRES